MSKNANRSAFVHPIAETHQLRVAAFHLWLKLAPCLRSGLMEAGAPWSSPARPKPPSWQEIQTWANFEPRHRPRHLRAMDDLTAYRDEITGLVRAGGLRPPEGVTAADFWAYAFGHQTACWLARHSGLDLDLPPVLVHKDAFFASGPDEDLAAVFAAEAERISPENVPQVLKTLNNEAQRSLRKYGSRKRERTPDYDRQLRVLLGRLVRRRSLYELAEEFGGESGMESQAVSRDIVSIAGRLGVDSSPVDRRDNAASKLVDVRR